MLKRILKFLFYLDIYIYSKDIMSTMKILIKLFCLMYILKEYDTIRLM